LTFLIIALMVLGATAWAQPTVFEELIVSDDDLDEYLPSVAYNSVRDEFMVVWHDSSGFQSRSIMGRRYTAAGSFLGEYVLMFEDTRDNAQPSIAYDPVNDRYLLTFVRDAFGNGADWDVWGRWIPWSGPDAGLTSFPICTFSSQQWNPRVAYAGTEHAYIVTWWNEGSGGVASYISAKFVNPTGTVSDPLNAITVASGADERALPDIAYNQARNEYLIVFQLMDAGGGDVYGVRLTASGSVLGTGEFGIAAWPDPETAPRVTASRTADEWAVVWQSDTPTDMKDIFARRLWVNGGGEVETAAPVHVVTNTGINERYPDIAVYQENATYLIAWEQQYSNPTSPYGISARTLNFLNTMGPIFQVRGLYIGEDPNCSQPALAGGAISWFVAWEHERSPIPNFQDIHGRIVSESFFFDGFESGNYFRWSSWTP
jgi:hypothetical protein